MTALAPRRFLFPVTGSSSVGGSVGSSLPTAGSTWVASSGDGWELRPQPFVAVTSSSGRPTSCSSEPGLCSPRTRFPPQVGHCSDVAPAGFYLPDGSSARMHAPTSSLSVTHERRRRLCRVWPAPGPLSGRRSAGAQRASAQRPQPPQVVHDRTGLLRGEAGAQHPSNHHVVAGSRTYPLGLALQPGCR